LIFLFERIIFLVISDLDYFDNLAKCYITSFAKMNEIEMYKASDDSTEIRVKFENESVWLTQKQMPPLFGK
jgi:hypothetical protein